MIGNGSASPAPSITHRAGGEDATVVEFCGVARTYGGPPPIEALKPCDVRIRRGEFITLVGPSGSGKSTLLNLLGLLDRPTAGVYRLDGVDTNALEESDLTALRGRRIGFVFQAFHLLANRDALENVMLAMLYTGVGRAERRHRAWETLERVGLARRATAPAGRLSGGERQRVAVARALVNRPSLLLCDEPTGNLDSVTAATVLALIDELNRDGYTVVVATHDAHVASRGDRTITIRDGTVHESAKLSQFGLHT